MTAQLVGSGPVAKFTTGFTAGQLFQCCALIARAEGVLGPLTDGQRSDLLLDNFEWIPSSVEAHAILEFLYPVVSHG